MTTVNIIIAIVGALGGVTGICSIFMIRANRRAKNVETDGQVAEQWRQYAEKADERYENLRIEKRDLWEKYNKVENQLVYYKTLHCRCIKCTEREPPLGGLLAEELGVKEEG